ncbi:MAG TPA: hypothetical protein VL360_01180 [Gammaproteobacteria bacterium]|nr:hypothetical protein [Gammaproteobacteria bacterium]
MHQDIEIEHEILLLAAVRDDREMSDYALCHLTYYIQNGKLSEDIARQLLGKSKAKISEPKPGSWGFDVTQSRLNRFVRLHHDDENMQYIMACLYAFGVPGVLDKDTAKANSLLEPLIKSNHAFALNLASIFANERLHPVDVSVEEQSEKYAAKARELKNPLAIYNYCEKGALYHFENRKYWSELGKIYIKLPQPLQVKIDNLVYRFERSLANLKADTAENKLELRRFVFHNRLASYYRERANTTVAGAEKFELQLASARQLVLTAASYDGCEHKSNDSIQAAKKAIVEFVKNLDLEKQSILLGKSTDDIARSMLGLEKMIYQFSVDMSLQQLITMREEINCEAESAFAAESLSKYNAEFNINSYSDRHVYVENNHAKYMNFDLKVKEAVKLINQECNNRIEATRNLLEKFIDDEFRDNFIHATSANASSGLFKARANTTEIDQFKNELETYYGFVRDKDLTPEEVLIKIHEYSASKIDKGEAELASFQKLHQMMLDLIDKPAHPSLAKIIIQRNLSSINIELPRP